MSNLPKRLSSAELQLRRPPRQFNNRLNFELHSRAIVLLASKRSENPLDEAITMIDPVSIVGLVSTILKDVIVVKNFVAGIHRAPRKIETLSDELSVIEGLLRDISSLVDGADEASMNRILRALTNCEKVAKQVDNLLRPYVKSSKGVTTWGRFTFGFKDSEVLELQMNMSACKQNLSLAIQHANFLTSNKNQRGMRRVQRKLGIESSSIAGTDIEERKQEVHVNVTEWISTVEEEEILDAANGKTKTSISAAQKLIKQTHYSDIMPAANEHLESGLPSNVHKSTQPRTSVISAGAGQSPPDPNPEMGQELLQGKPIEVYVSRVGGGGYGALSLVVDQHWTIGVLKIVLEGKHGISSSQHVLLIAGKNTPQKVVPYVELDDTKTFSFYAIQNRSTIWFKDAGGSHSANAEVVSMTKDKEVLKAIESESTTKEYNYQRDKNRSYSSLSIVSTISTVSSTERNTRSTVRTKKANNHTRPLSINRNNNMTIYIKYLLNDIHKTDTLSVARSWTVSSVKQEVLSDIEHRDKIILKRQRFIFKGNPLQDNFTLRQCGIEDGDTLHMVSVPKKRVASQGPGRTGASTGQREIGIFEPKKSSGNRWSIAAGPSSSRNAVPQSLSGNRWSIVAGPSNSRNDIPQWPSYRTDQQWPSDNSSSTSIGKASKGSRILPWNWKKDSGRSESSNRTDTTVSKGKYTPYTPPPETPRYRETQLPRTFNDANTQSNRWDPRIRKLVITFQAMSWGKTQLVANHFTPNSMVDELRDFLRRKDRRKDYFHLLMLGGEKMKNGRSLSFYHIENDARIMVNTLQLE